MQFGILGPLEVRDGGQQKIELGTPKQRAMLAVLVVAAGEVVSTDRLADLLWDGAPPARAEVSIRSYATNLRRVLDPHRAAGAPTSLLVSGGGGYRLRLEDVDVDARRFELLVAEARAARASGDPAAALALLDDALALWRGPALADVAGEPFARGEAARLEELRIGAEEERLEALLDLGRQREVVAAVEPLLVLHPAREHLRAIHMTALHRCGRPSEALASYRDLRDHLADRAGLDPSPALQALHEAIRTGDEDGGVVPVDGDGPPLVGRDAELAVLADAADSALAGSGRIVLVAGDAGIGKTRLVDELARRQAGRAVVACGRGIEAGDAPAFWPWAEILRLLAGDDRVDLRAVLDARTADAAALVPALADAVLPPAPALAPDAARFQRYDAVATLLARTASQRPLVLALDDLQWFDAGSLRLLVYLAGVAATAPLLVVATYRPEDAGAAELRNALAELARSAAVTRLDLAGLGPDDVSRLAGRLATDPLPEEVLAAIVDRAGGNPFYVTELLRAGAGTEGASVPAGVRDVVRRRLQHLAPTTAALLTTAAVVGTTVDIDLLDAVEGRDTLDEVEDAVAAHLLEETGERPGQYRFSHALVREVLLDGLSALRRARLHATIARALDGRPDRDPETRLAELARHCCGGAAIDEEVAARAVSVSLEAAEQAMSRLGYDTARAHYERALAAIEDGADVAAVDHGALLVGLAAALRAEGDPAASREACLRAGELARRAGAPELLATAALGLALPGSVIGMDFGVLDEARIELLEEALRGLGPEDTPIRIRVLVHLGLALYLSEDRARRDEVAAEAVAAADRLGHPGLRAAAAAARHSTLWGTPPVDERVQAAQRIVELAEAGGAAQTALEGHIALAIDLLEAGDLAGFRRELATVDRDAVALRQPFYQWYSRVFDATVASMEGRYADASAAAESARAAGGAALGRRAIWGQIGWQYVTAWDAGGLEEAERPLRALASAFPDGIVVRCALAHVLAELGRRDEASALAEPLLADPVGRVPQDAMWLFSLALLAELAWLLEDEEGAARVATALAPARGRLVVVGSGVACCGAVERSLGLVALAARRVDEAEDLLAVALERNRHVGARPWALRTMAAQASMLRVRARPGDKEQAQALLAEAASGAAGLGAHGLLRAIDRLREA